MSRPRSRMTPAIHAEALRLLTDPLFLYRVGKKIGELGVIGEHRNRLILFLAGVARTLSDPPSVIVKGSTSSGKSTLVRDSIQLFPSTSVIERAGLSRKALAYGEVPLSRKILFISEYRCGKDAQLLLRLLQSEGQIEHEATTIRGGNRHTKTVKRIGTPVVITTTTDQDVFSDDETRFLSLWVDESSEQTRAILAAQARRLPKVDDHDLSVWRTAVSLLKSKKGDFCNPPQWLEYVSKQVPLSQVRVRRDWPRFITFLKAVAICSSGAESNEPRNICFGDYCAAYRIFSTVFASTLRGLPEQELCVSIAVRTLAQRSLRPVTTKEVAAHLGWKRSLVYKHVKAAIDHKLLERESGTRARNVKGLVAPESASAGFLPSPRSVFDANPAIGEEIRYVHPLSGLTKVLRRRPRTQGGDGAETDKS